MLRGNLTKLKENLIIESRLVEGMLEKAIKGLSEKNKDQLQNIIDEDEPRVNKMEIELDRSCINTMALFQPEAKDLRTVYTYAKMNTTYERTADQAVNIAESALELCEGPLFSESDVLSLNELFKMAEKTKEMLKDVTEAFIKDNTKAAIGVCKKDETVDKIGYELMQKVQEEMKNDATIIQSALHVTRISKNLERMADQATNLAEDVIYIVEGKIIKHFEEE